jgi:hypothetical protein
LRHPLKIHMCLVVVKILDWIFDPGIKLNTWDFELVGELNHQDTLSKWGRPIQEAIHSGSFSLIPLVDLLLEPVVFFFMLLVESDDSFVEPSFSEQRIHNTFSARVHVSTMRRVSDTSRLPRLIFKLTSFGSSSSPPCVCVEILI